MGKTILPWVLAVPDMSAMDLHILLLVERLRDDGVVANSRRGSVCLALEDDKDELE